MKLFSQRSLQPAAIFTLLLLALPALAQDYEAVRERLMGLTGEGVTPIIAETPIDGILQVRLGSEVVYMSDDARYLMQGRLLDLESRRDLTDQAKSDARREAMAGIDESQMITYGPDDAAHEIMVFTDVDCGFCRKLHEEIPQYSEAGIKIHYLAFPRAGSASITFNKMQSVWCSADPNAAMDVAKSGGEPDPASCDSPVDAQYQLGQSVGVTGTPAMVTVNGDLIPGYVPPDDLRNRLEQLDAASTAE
ncbi:MAG: DsbC family protein [Pseudomonadota bacterium]